jgi:hypothetical protein
MPLSGMFQSPTQELSRKVLYLAYSDQSVEAHLLELTGTTAKILEHSTSEQFSDQASALVRTDECLQQLGPDSESISEVLLGLDPNWVQNGEIAVDKKPFLKQVFTDLSLKPLGFISFAEALSQQLIAKDSSASLLLLYCAEKKISIVQLQKGVIERAESVGRSEDIVADMTEGIARFTKEGGETEYLPSTLLLASFALSDEQLTELQQQLLAHSWTATQLFLQPPVISIIPRQDVINSIALEASAVLQVDAAMTSQSSSAEAINTQSPASTQPTTRTPASSAAGHDNLVTTEPERAVESLPKSFGIPLSPTQLESAREGFGTLISEDATDPVKTHTEQLRPPKLLAHHIKKSALIGAVAGVGALVILTVGAVSFFTTAVVSVTLTQKPLSADLEITLDPQAVNTDVEKRVLAATTITEEVTGEGTAETTGVKIVGEKATGEILIYNKTTAEKSFDAGTKLTAGGVVFHLTQAVTIPAAKVEQTGSREVKDYGQSTATIEADLIGDAGNKPEKTELTVASFATSSYSAEAVKGFTGGSSREVRVVSQADRTELQKEVLRKVLDAANEDFKTRSGSGTYILTTTDITVTDAQFDAAVETEANTLSLALTAQVSALSYATADIHPIAEAALKTKIPEGFVLSPEDPQVLSAPTQQSSVTSDPVELKVNISSYAVASPNSELWQAGIAGKSVGEAQQYLEKLDEVSRATVVLQPSLLMRVYPKLPSSAERITILFPSQSN